MAGWDDVPDASAKPAPTAKGWDAVPDVKAPALDFQPAKDPKTGQEYPFKIAKGEAPTGGSATIRDDGAINFPGQSNWLFYDQKSKQYAPAPSEPWEKKGFMSSNFGADAAMERGRNFGIGTEKAVNAGLSLVQKAIPASWQPADQAQTDQATQMTNAQRIAAINATQRESAKKYQDIGQAAPAMAVSGLVAAPAAGAGFFARHLPSAIAFGTGAGVTTEGDLGDRALTAGLGAGATLLGSAAIEKVAVPILGATWNGGKYLVGKLKNAWNGVMAEEYAPLLKAAAENNIDAYTVGQITRNKGAAAIERTQQVLPDVAGGTTGRYVKGLKQIQAAVEAKKDALNTALQGTEYGGIEGVQKAAASGDRNAARVLREFVDTAKDDPYGVLKADLNVQQIVSKLEDNRLYGKVGDIVKGHGDVELSKPLTWIQDQLDTQLGNEAKGIRATTTPNKALVETLQDLKATLSNPKNDLSYNGIRSSVSALGDTARGLAEGEPAVATKLGDLRGIMRSAMDEHVEGLGIPEATQALNNANSHYQNTTLKYKAQDVARMINGTDADTAVKAMFSKGSPAQFQRIYDLTSEKGKAAIASGMVQQAAGEVGGKEAAAMSPAQWATYFENRAKQSDLVFNGTDRARMDGFTKLLRAMDETGQTDAGKNTGKSLGLLHMIIGGGLAKLSLPAAGASLAVSTALKSLFTGAGRPILLAASELKPGDPAFRLLVKEAQAVMSKPIAQAGGAEAAAKVTPLLRPPLPKAAGEGTPGTASK